MWNVALAISWNKISLFYFTFILFYFKQPLFILLYFTLILFQVTFYALALVNYDNPSAGGL